MSEETFESQVTKAIEGVTKSDDGKIIFPEGTDEAVRFAANTEIRRRDTQSALHKTKDELMLTRAEADKLAESWANEFVAKLSEDEQHELNELKHSNPEAWRVRLNELESTNKSKFEETRNDVKKRARQETELQKRQRLLEEHNKSNPELAISDDVYDNDIPTRLKAKLETGEISFEEFLKDATKYLSTPKAIGGGNEDEDLDEPNLRDMGGSAKPSEDAVAKDIVKSYSNETY